MLKQILSISGKPGLYKLLSKSKVTIIVESLSDKKKLPVHASDKVVSLGDISMFIQEGEVPLWEVLENIKNKENNQKASLNPKSSNDELKKYLEEVLPDYDREKVYPSDIKKLISWYNLLIETGNTEFKPEEKDDSEEKENKEQKQEEVKA
ncbi:MAG: DUF5606 domain-containing protein [Candidatus Azobacteroides sp.]|nr:DUF5606 domain-containing protein [Candidatus Azobacteroides sp.]